MSAARLMMFLSFIGTEFLSQAYRTAFSRAIARIFWTVSSLNDSSGFMSRSHRDGLRPERDARVLRSRPELCLDLLQQRRTLVVHDDGRVRHVARAVVGQTRAAVPGNQRRAVSSDDESPV